MGNDAGFPIFSSGFSAETAERLSALDKLCVGAEGWSAASFLSESEKPNGIVLYIMDGDEVIALLSGYHAAGEGDITSVAVCPDYRRRGLASALLKEFERLLPEDTESIFLEVRQSNSAAIELYRQAGFEDLSVRKRFYSAPEEDALVMRKELHKE